MKTPDWNLWQHMPNAELWQVVLLSLNIDPDQFDSEYGNYHDYFREDKEASKRLRLLDANRYRIYPLGVDRLIPLAPFAKWAVSVMQWALPPELIALARKQTYAPEQNNASTKVDAGDVAAEEDESTQESGEPYLQKGRNSRKAVENWVAWQANSRVEKDDTVADLAKRIWLIAERWGYESERGKMTVASITKMIPAGLTGGRSKNKR
jgi:hypothetical protein